MKNNELFSTLVDLLLKNRRYNTSVVFDIDGTIIDDRYYTATTAKQLVLPVYQFYKYCMKKDIPIFIVTARPPNNGNDHATINVLNNIELDMNRIYFCHRGIDPMISKLDCRNDIRSLGYHITLSIGDNLCDIDRKEGVGILVKKQDDDNVDVKIMQ